MTDSEATSDPPQGTTTTTEGPATPGYLMSPNAVFADEGVQWRYGKAPDYSKTRKVWEEGMTFATTYYVLAENAAR